MYEKIIKKIIKQEIVQTIPLVFPTWPKHPLIFAYPHKILIFWKLEFLSRKISLSYRGINNNTPLLRFKNNKFFKKINVKSLRSPYGVCGKPFSFRVNSSSLATTPSWSPWQVKDFMKELLLLWKDIEIVEWRKSIFFIIHLCSWVSKDLRKE